MNSTIDYAYMHEYDFPSFNYHNIGKTDFNLAVENLYYSQMNDFDKLKLIDGLNKNPDAIDWLNDNKEYITPFVILDNLEIMYPVLRNNISLFAEDACIGFYGIRNMEITKTIITYGTIVDILNLYNRMTDFSDMKYGIGDSYYILKKCMYQLLLQKSIKQELIEYLMRPEKIEKYIMKHGIENISNYLQ